MAVYSDIALLQRQIVSLVTSCPEVIHANAQLAHMFGRDEDRMNPSFRLGYPQKELP
jgi:hypothetical protein